MDAIDLLKEQHHEVRALFEELRRTDDEDEKQALFHEIADILAAHTIIEERLFYPFAFATRAGDRGDQALADHQIIKHAIAELLALAPEHQDFEDRLARLREQVEHHLQQEESDIFGATRGAFSDDILRRLGADMARLFEEEMEGEPSEGFELQYRRDFAARP